MPGGPTRSLSDLFGRFGRRDDESAAPAAAGSAAASSTHPTKALSKFLSALVARPSPTLLDLGPVVGSNVSFFGEQLGCKIFVEDVYKDLDEHVRTGRLDAFGDFLARRFPRADGSVDGILCWDLFDYLDRPAAQVLATELARLLRPDGALLAFFSNAEPKPGAPAAYTRFLVVDDDHLEHRPHAAKRGKQRMWLNRDINRLFEALRVSESFLLKHNLREVLFRKPEEPAPHVR